MSVLRQGMASDGEDRAGVYFGTAGGQVFDGDEIRIHQAISGG